MSTMRITHLNIRSPIQQFVLKFCLLSFHGRQFSLFSYLILTPWIRVLEKLTDSQLVKKFPTFYGNQRFNTAFTSACHLSLLWARLIQSMSPHPTSWRSIIILSSHLSLGLPSCFFSPLLVSPPKLCMHLSSPPYMLHAPHISFFLIWSPEC